MRRKNLDYNELRWELTDLIASAAVKAREISAKADREGNQDVVECADVVAESLHACEKNHLAELRAAIATVVAKREE